MFIYFFYIKPLYIRISLCPSINCMTVLHSSRQTHRAPDDFFWGVARVERGGDTSPEKKRNP